MSAETIPLCSTSSHGPMAERDPATVTAEQRWCGTWYDCARPHCRNSAVVPSPELRADLDEQARAAAAAQGRLFGVQP